MSKLPEYINSNKWLKKFKYLRKVNRKEVYDFDIVLACYLLERMKQYRGDATEIVDLTYYKGVYNGKEYSQLELIDMIIKKLEFYFTEIDYSVNSFEQDQEHNKAAQEAIRIIAEIFPALWW